MTRNQFIFCRPYVNPLKWIQCEKPVFCVKTDQVENMKFQLEYLVDLVVNHQVKSVWLVVLTTAVSPWGNRVVRIENTENGSCMTCLLGAVAHTPSTGLATRGNPKSTPGQARMIGNHGHNTKTQTVVYNTQFRK